MVTAAIRSRLVSHLPNIDAKLAARVAKGLGLRDKVQAAVPAAEPRTDLKPSKALSILLNGPTSFAGRKVGVLVTDGTDITVFESLKSAVEAEGAVVEVIAPVIGGVKASDGNLLEAKQKVGGGPSVLYDAVAVLPSEAGATALAANPAALDFVRDAFAHLKFIAYSEGALTLFEKTGLKSEIDAGFIPLQSAKAVTAFITNCRKLRYWDREQVLQG